MKTRGKSVPGRGRGGSRGAVHAKALWQERASRTPGTDGWCDEESDMRSGGKLTDVTVLRSY